MALLSCPVHEVFFGGARFGGKSIGSLLDFLGHGLTYGLDATGIFFRRTVPRLEELVHESQSIYPKTGALWNKSGRLWEWVSGPGKGARLKFRHLWDERDAADHQGSSFSWMCFEELGDWPTLTPMNLLRACLRSAKGIPVFLRSTGNPGGAGHGAIKARYIDPAPKGYKIITDPVTKQHRVFIPSKLEDNRIALKNDPNYEQRLYGVGSDALVKAWRWGIWDIVAGGFFDDVWRPERHILKPFPIPTGWTFRRSFDWGFSKPSALGLWAISDGSAVPELPGRRFPRGSAIMIGEWYTVQHDASGIVKPNEGLKLSNGELGAGIARLSVGRNWSGCVADPSIFTAAGGPSIYQQLREGAKGYGGLSFLPADNTRVAGWLHMRGMLEEAAKDTPEKPGLWIFDTCVDFIRTVPVLQRDMKKPDDVDSSGDDHAADSCRYMVMSLVSRQVSQQRVVGFY
jgi:hypothetical protein